MIDNETFEKILKICVQAPSGHNSQPWKFIIDNNEIQLWNIPEKDEILFNYKDRGSFISHGCVIENINIVSAEFGYNVETILFPNKEDCNFVARIKLTKNENNYSYKNLFKNISKRKTNRRKYESKQLSKEDLDFIKNISRSETKDGFEIFTTDNKEIIGLAAKYFSIGDKMIFENRHVHEALFSNVNWTLEDELNKKEGLFVKTKELSPINEFIFRNMLGKWNIIKHLQWLNISKVAGKKRQKLYEKSAIVGMILAPDLSLKNIVKAGRILQRFWLSTCEKNISFQPLTVGLLYLGQRTHDEKHIEEFTEKQISEIRTSYDNIISNVLKKDCIPVFSFRLGYSKPPTAQSLKKDPFIVYKK